MNQEQTQKLEELKKKREQLDKLIEELTTHDFNDDTNISYTHKFIDRYTLQPQIPTTTTNPRDIFNIKLFINKKANQISSDYNHTNNLIAELMPLKDNSTFIDIFARKMIEQGRIQVSSHLESYKPFSYIIHSINSNNLIQVYVSLMIMCKGSERELCGIYAIYFGFLTLSEDVQASWFWMAGVLNSKPSEYSGHVFETFLVICGEMLSQKCGLKFHKVLKYIKDYFLKELNNKPVECRISNLIEKFEKVQ